jgi:anti-sigma factor RsiW
MDENLVGYLLDTLEPEERQDVEAHLLSNSAARERLQQLRQLLEPLQADLQAIEPPRDLRFRTLARVAEHQCRSLPPSPKPLRPRSLAAPRGWWRRADVLVAATLLLALSLFLPPGINYVRYRYNIAACQENLRLFHGALQDYSQRNHGNFPNVAAAPVPYNVAGFFVPMLHDDGVLAENITVTCPTRGRQAPPQLSADEVVHMDEDEFARFAPTLSGCYAYTLGYRDSTGYHGLRFDPNDPATSYLPILADQPPADVAEGNLGNSPNHGGKGQNVLYSDGRCSFMTTRWIGPNRDDIYLNSDNKVAAGTHCMDTVLGRSAARP